MNDRSVMEMDLLFKGAHVIDPAQDLDGICDVCITAGKISAVGKDLPAPQGTQVLDARGTYLCPGLVDIHGHWYEGDLYGIDPRSCLNHGVTTAIDAGSTGYANFPAFRKQTIDKSPVNLFAFVHISFMGLLAPFAEELLDLSYARPIETAEVVARNRDRALGIKIRIGSMTGNHGLEALARAIQAAGEARVPLMVHVSKGAEEAAILNRLRAGDIITHCFHGRGNRLFEHEGKSTMRLVAEARERGIVFDIGHGCGSFSWETAQRAYEHEFYPDTLSTDLHRYCVGEPFAVTLPSVMSKFLCLGMSLRDVVHKTTWAPARVLGLEGEIGSSRVGSRADLLQFDLAAGEFEFQDTHRETRVGAHRIAPRTVVKDGIAHRPGSFDVRFRDFFDSDLEVFRGMGWPVPPKSQI
jgi:dihydroorotase